MSWWILAVAGLLAVASVRGSTWSMVIHYVAIVLLVAIAAALYIVEKGLLR